MCDHDQDDGIIRASFDGSSGRAAPTGWTRRFARHGRFARATIKAGNLKPE
jgi:hypothetical protein